MAGDSNTFPISLDNREIAILFWIAISAIWLSRNSDVRGSVYNFLKVLFSRQILTTFGIALAWTVACVWLLASLDVWRWENLKATALWYIAISFGMILNVEALSERTGYIGKTIRETINLTVVVSFVVETYTLSLPVELILVPIVTFVAMAAGFAKNKPEYKATVWLLDRFLLIVGLIYFGHAVYAAWSDAARFLSWKTAREFGAPAILSFLFLPFMFAFGIYVAYDTAFSRLRFSISHDSLRRYAGFKALRTFGPDVVSLRQWLNYMQINKPSSRDDVDRSITEWDQRRVHRYDAPQVETDEGWAIEVATFLMADEGIACDEYSPSTPGAWGAAARARDLGSVTHGSAAWFYISGTEKAVKSLHMEFWMVQDKHLSKSEARAMALYRKFIERALRSSVPGTFKKGIRRRGELELVVGDRKILYARNDFDGGYNAAITIQLASYLSAERDN